MVVPQDKHIPVQRGLFPQETTDGLPQQVPFHRSLHRIALCPETFFQLLQRHVVHAAAPFLGPLGTIPVDGQLPGDLSQEEGELRRPVGWNGIPGPEPRVVDAFLHIFRLGENIPCDAAAVVPILLCRGCNGCFLPVPIQG